MCNGIAHSGNGISQYILNPTEGLTRKCARLLTAAMFPRPIKISLNISPEGSGADDLESIAAYSKDASKSHSGSPVLYSTSALCPGTRFHAYLMLPSPTVFPKSVVLHAQLHSGEQLSLDIPVSERVINQGSNPLIHPLVAQKLIQDLNPSDPETREMSMKLAKAHNILSEVTSFISVDESGPNMSYVRKMKSSSPPPYIRGRGGNGGRGNARLTDGGGTTRGSRYASLSSASSASSVSTTARHQSNQLSAIARHQNFDGSFRSSVLPLCPLENTVLPASVMTIENDEELRARISASLFVTRFLKTKMKDEQEAWEMMYEKAVAFLRGTLLVSAAELDEFLQFEEHVEDEAKGN
jgi:hypothetical protein